MTEEAEGLDVIPFAGRAASPDADAEGPNYKWWVVFMLWFVCFLNNADRQAIPAILPKLEKLYHFDTTQLGLIASAFAWIYAFGSPIAGFVGDRLRRKNLILGACGFWSVVAAGTGLCSKFWQFIVVRALTGVGETLYFPAAMSMLSDYHGPRTRSKAMSLHQSSVYIGNILGMWLIALLADLYNWQLGFYFFGGAGVILAFVLLFLLREPRRGRSTAVSVPVPPATGVANADAPKVLDYQAPVKHEMLNVREIRKAIFRKPTAILLMAAFMCANFVSAIFSAWATYFLVEKFHISNAQAALRFSLFFFSGCAISVPLGGIMADFFSRRIVGGRMIVQAIGLIFGTTFIVLASNKEDIRAVEVAMAFFGIGKGIYDSNIFASMYDVIEPRARATSAGLLNTIAWGGGALGPTFVGWFTKHGHGTKLQNMSHAFAMTAYVYVMGAILLLVAGFVFAPRDHVPDDGGTQPPVVPAH